MKYESEILKVMHQDAIEAYKIGAITSQNGAIPLEAMDLTINPRKEEVVGAHGDQIIHSVK